LRLVSYDLKALMKKHDIDYEYEWFWQTIWYMIQHMARMAKKYTESR
jgi:hypothetical protein